MPPIQTGHGTYKASNDLDYFKSLLNLRDEKDPERITKLLSQLDPKILKQAILEIAKNNVVGTKEIKDKLAQIYFEGEIRDGKLYYGPVEFGSFANGPGMDPLFSKLQQESMQRLIDDPNISQVILASPCLAQDDFGSPRHYIYVYKKEGNKIKSYAIEAPADLNNGKRDRLSEVMSELGVTKTVFSPASGAVLYQPVYNSAANLFDPDKMPVILSKVYAGRTGEPEIQDIISRQMDVVVNRQKIEAEIKSQTEALYKALVKIIKISDDPVGTMKVILSLYDKETKLIDTNALSPEQLIKLIQSYAKPSPDNQTREPTYRAAVIPVLQSFSDVRLPMVDNSSSVSSHANFLQSNYVMSGKNESQDIPVYAFSPSRQEVRQFYSSAESSVFAGSTQIESVVETNNPSRTSNFEFDVKKYEDSRRGFYRFNSPKKYTTRIKKRTSINPALLNKFEVKTVAASSLDALATGKISAQLFQEIIAGIKNTNPRLQIKASVRNNVASTANNTSTVIKNVPNKQDIISTTNTKKTKRPEKNISNLSIPLKSQSVSPDIAVPNPRKTQLRGVRNSRYKSAQPKQPAITKLDRTTKLTTNPPVNRPRRKTRRLMTKSTSLLRLGRSQFRNKRLRIQRNVDSTKLILFKERKIKPLLKKASLKTTQISSVKPVKKINFTRKVSKNIKTLSDKVKPKVQFLIKKIKLSFDELKLINRFNKTTITQIKDKKVKILNRLKQETVKIVKKLSSAVIQVKIVYSTLKNSSRKISQLVSSIKIIQPALRKLKSISKSISSSMKSIKVQLAKLSKIKLIIAKISKIKIYLKSKYSTKLLLNSIKKQILKISNIKKLVVKINKLKVRLVQLKTALVLKTKKIKESFSTILKKLTIKNTVTKLTNFISIKFKNIKLAVQNYFRYSMTPVIKLILRVLRISKIKIKLKNSYILNFIYWINEQSKKKQRLKFLSYWLRRGLKNSSKLTKNIIKKIMLLLIPTKQS